MPDCVRLRPWLRVLSLAALLTAAACRAGPVASPTPAETVAREASGTATTAAPTLPPDTPTSVPPAATASPEPSPTTEPPTAAPPTVEPPTPTEAPTAAPVAPAAATLPYHPVRDLAWSPTGDRLAVVTGAAIHLADLSGAAEPRTIDAGVEVASIAFHPTAPILAAGTVSKTVQLWDIETGTLLRTLTGPDAPDPVMAYSPDNATLHDITFDGDGSQLAACVEGYYHGGVGTVWLWQVETEDSARVLLTYGAAVRVGYLPSSDTVAVATWAQSFSRGGGGIALWPPGAEEPALTLTCSRCPVWDLALGPGGLVAGVTAGDDICSSMVAHLWDATTGTELRVLPSDGTATCLALTPDGALLAVGDDAGGVALWGVAAGESRGTLAAAAGRLRGLAFDPSGRRLAAWNEDGDATLLQWP